MASVEFTRNEVQPVDCIREGWELIRDQYMLFVGITFVGLLVGGVCAIALMGPMLCGIFLCLFRKMKGQSVEFGMLFKGFDMFGPAFVTLLLQMLMGIAAAIVAYIPMIIVALIGYMTRAGMLVTILTIPCVLFALVVMIVFSALVMYSFPLVVEHKLAPMEAIKTSISAVWANLTSHVLLFILGQLVITLGLCCCFIGVYFAIPVVFASQVVAYRKVFGLADGRAARRSRAEEDEYEDEDDR